MKTEKEIIIELQNLYRQLNNLYTNKKKISPIAISNYKLGINWLEWVLEKYFDDFGNEITKEQWYAQKDNKVGVNTFDKQCQRKKK